MQNSGVLLCKKNCQVVDKVTCTFIVVLNTSVEAIKHNDVYVQQIFVVMYTAYFASQCSVYKYTMGF